MLRSSSARISPTVTSTDRTADISNRLIVVTTVVATVGCVYPGFLIGAITVQVRDEFDVSAATYGWAMGTYFPRGDLRLDPGWATGPTRGTASTADRMPHHDHGRSGVDCCDR